MSGLLSTIQVSIYNTKLPFDNVEHGNHEKMKIKIDLTHQTHLFIKGASAMCFSIFLRSKVMLEI